jgi:F-type H+-transporting ATPase subunit delta
MSDASDERIQRYAEAILEVALAEQHERLVVDQLYSFKAAYEQSDELRDALMNPQIDPAQRQQIVEDILGAGQAAPATIAAVSLVVCTGRARELAPIIDKVVEMQAHKVGKAVAEVRTAIPLSDDQKQRLAEALKAATGDDVEVRVTVDPSILGGVIAEIGETVIDGSVRDRLAQLREAI